ncbi:MAG: hypothetical protein QXK88_02355 [Desulfurococcaceae archaeon]
MPRISPGTLIIDLELVQPEEIRSLINFLIEGGVNTVGLTSEPAIVEVLVDNLQVSLAVSAPALLIRPPAAVGPFGERFYEIVKDVWINCVWVNPKTVLKGIEAVLQGKNTKINTLHVSFLEKEETCSGIVVTGHLCLKALYRQSAGTLNYTTVWSSIKNLLRYNKGVLAVCVKDSAVTPFISLEDSDTEKNLIIHIPKSEAELRTAMWVLIDVLMYLHSEAEDLGLVEAVDV